MSFISPTDFCTRYVSGDWSQLFVFVDFNSSPNLMLFLLKITQLTHNQPNHHTATSSNPNTNCTMRNQFQFLLFLVVWPYMGDFPQADYTGHWRIHEGSQECTPPLSPISFIFMPFSAKILTNNKFLSQIQELAPPPSSGKSWIHHCWKVLFVRK